MGWLPGEQLWIKVRFRERRDGGDGELRHLETYILEATPMGWYRRVSSNLIFAIESTVRLFFACWWRASLSSAAARPAS